VGRLRVLAAGGGDEPLLLVHGWPACARVFWPLLVSAPLGARFRIQAPDLPGFGRSAGGASGDTVTFARQVDAVLALAAQDAAGPIAVVGASFGARVVLEAVARRPELFGRVILLGPYLHRGLLRPGLAARVLARFPRQVRLLYRWPLSLLTGLWAVACGVAAAGPSRAWARQVFPLLADVARIRPGTLDVVGSIPDGRAHLRGLRVPVEIWFGARDRLLDTGQLAALASVPGVSLRCVEGGGHALHDSHAPELAAALLAGAGVPRGAAA